MICSDANFLDFHIWQESSSNDFCYVDCTADGFSACFDVYLFCSTMEECDAGKHVVHDWFVSDQHRVAL